MNEGPRLDDIVTDTNADKLGRVMGFVGLYVQLRPLGGGREWDARPEHLKPARCSEALKASVAEANARSRTKAAMVANAELPDAKESRTPVDTHSAECALALRPGYEDLHRTCRQTHDALLPGTSGIVLVPRCGCACHITDENPPGTWSI